MDWKALLILQVIDIANGFKIFEKEINIKKSKLNFVLLQFPYREIKIKGVKILPYIKIENILIDCSKLRIKYRRNQQILNSTSTQISTHPLLGTYLRPNN